MQHMHVISQFFPYIFNINKLFEKVVLLYFFLFVISSLLALAALSITCSSITNSCAIIQILLLKQDHSMDRLSIIERPSKLTESFVIKRPSELIEASIIGFLFYMNFSLKTRPLVGRIVNQIIYMGYLHH